MDEIQIDMQNIRKILRQRFKMFSFAHLNDLKITSFGRYQIVVFDRRISRYGYYRMKTPLSDFDSLNVFYSGGQYERFARWATKWMNSVHR